MWAFMLPEAVEDLEMIDMRLGFRLHLLEPSVE